MADKVNMLCERSERYQNQIDEYLVEISERDIDRECRAYHKLISTANTAFGRMGKLAERLLELIKRSAESPDDGAAGGEVEARILGESIFEIMQLTINGFMVQSSSVSQTIRCYREEIMELASIIKRRYIRELHEKGLEMSPDSLFADISYILEQLIDYCDMIADALIRYHAEIGDEEQVDTGTDETTRRQIHMLFRDKYEALGINESTVSRN